MDKSKINLCLDFSKDVIKKTKSRIVVLRVYEVFTKNDLEEVLDKVCYLRLTNKGLKITMINIVANLEVKLDENVISRYFLQTDRNDVLSKDIEILISSLKAAKESDSECKFVHWLKFLGAETFDEMERVVAGDKVLEETYKKVKKFYKSKEYAEIEKIFQEEEKLAGKEEKM